MGEDEFSEEIDEHDSEAGRIVHHFLELSLSARINTIFSLIMIPILLIWSYSMLTGANAVNEINEEQLERCTYLQCHTTMWGQLRCSPEEIPQRLRGGGGQPFDIPNGTNLTSLPTGALAESGPP